MRLSCCLFLASLLLAAPVLAEESAQPGIGVQLADIVKATDGECSLDLSKDTVKATLGDRSFLGAAANQFAFKLDCDRYTRSTIMVFVDKNTQQVQEVVYLWPLKPSTESQAQHSADVAKALMSRIFILDVENAREMLSQLVVAVKDKRAQGKSGSDLYRAISVGPNMVLLRLLNPDTKDEAYTFQFAPKPSENSPPLPARGLTEQRLAGKILVNETREPITLNLNKDGRFKFSFSADGPLHEAEGSWSLRDGALALRVDNASIAGTPRSPAQYGGFQRAHCTLQADHSSVEYAEFLGCQGENNAPWGSPRFPMPDTLLKPGAIRTVEGVKIVLLDRSRGIPTASLLLRRSPTPDGAVIDMSRLCPECGLPPGGVIPVDGGPNRVSMVVYGRTEEKARIGTSENYWLYVQVAGTAFGWVFGDFVRITTEK